MTQGSILRHKLAAFVPSAVLGLFVLYAGAFSVDAVGYGGHLPADHYPEASLARLPWFVREAMKVRDPRFVAYASLVWNVVGAMGVVAWHTLGRRQWVVYGCLTVGLVVALLDLTSLGIMAHYQPALLDILVLHARDQSPIEATLWEWDVGTVVEYGARYLPLLLLCAALVCGGFRCDTDAARQIGLPGGLRAASEHDDGG